MTKEQVLAIIRKKVRDCEGQYRAAESYGISAQHLSDILSGKRALRGRILVSLGLKEVVRYERAKEVL